VTLPGRRSRLLARAVPGFPIAAIPLGHVVLARSSETVETFRRQKRVHVAQWACWGLLFPFAYLGSSLLARLLGRDAYLDSAFEREAFQRSGPAG
jgi:hypothetical protein